MNYEFRLSKIDISIYFRFQIGLLITFRSMDVRKAILIDLPFMMISFMWYY